MRMHGGVSYPALVLQSIDKPYDLLPSQKGASVFPGGASLCLLLPHSSPSVLTGLRGHQWDLGMGSLSWTPDPLDPSCPPSAGPCVIGAGLRG